ncbi:hypothetical protein AAFC00_001143 [Neodothiora populina]|uniref:Tetratricopeptide SHNi-TPR domain-containing protein n=1 Tax=Neodothiora populina TaxID=2781224 RepID=A0ABR3PMZ0_9PEZI
MADPITAPAPAEAAEAAAPSATQAQLTKLRDSATREYSLKNYSAAAELYSEATEIQAELNGEMNPSNAALLYAYGRCLYHVAVSKSDVLGGKVAGGEQEPAKKKRKTKQSDTEAAAPAAEPKEEDASAAEADKPFFQITGDENWTDSDDDDDDDDEDAGEAEEGAEDEDDFAIAYEILDVARVLLTRRLESLSTSEQTDGKGKGKAKEIPPEETPEGRQIMERLADTHDLQAEISLENERFSDAVADEKASLDLKLRLFPLESSLVAEAHYKLSLALEFASVTQTQSEGEAANAAAANATSQVDEEMRAEAAKHMESAIESCKLRIEKEKQSLPSLAADQKKDKERSISDVTEMVGDMEQRLIDLRNPAVAMGAPAEDSTDASNPLGGILGSILGESAAAQKAKIEEATKSANDLTGLIKHKKKRQPEPSAIKQEDGSAALTTDVEANGGKRKAPTEGEAEEEASGKEGKRVKFADA